MSDPANQTRTTGSMTAAEQVSVGCSLGFLVVAPVMILVGSGLSVLGLSGILTLLALATVAGAGRRCLRGYAVRL